MQPPRLTIELSNSKMAGASWNCSSAPPQLNKEARNLARRLQSPSQRRKAGSWSGVWPDYSGGDSEAAQNNRAAGQSWLFRQASNQPHTSGKQTHGGASGSNLRQTARLNWWRWKRSGAPDTLRTPPAAEGKLFINPQFTNVAQPYRNLKNRSQSTLTVKKS